MYQGNQLLSVSLITLQLTFILSNLNHFFLGGSYLLIHNVLFKNRPSKPHHLLQTQILHLRQTNHPPEVPSLRLHQIQ